MGSGGYGVRSGDPLVKPHLGRRQTTTSHRGRRVDPETASLRLAVWKRRALIGDRVADIAAELRMNRAALEQYIVRARKRGHPNAVYHMAAGRT